MKQIAITCAIIVALSGTAMAQSSNGGMLGIGAGGTFTGTTGFSTIDSFATGSGTFQSGGSFTDASANAIGRGSILGGALGNVGTNIGSNIGAAADVRAFSSSNSGSSAYTPAGNIGGSAAQLTRGFSSATAGGIGAGSLSRLGPTGTMNLFNSLGAGAAVR